MRRSMRVFAATAAVLALGLAGCSSGSGGQSGNQSGNNEGAEGATDAVPASAINAHDRADLEKGGQLRFAISSMPTSWNTMNVNGNQVDLASTMATFIAPANWIYQGDGTFDVNPNYVESFDVKDGDGADTPQVVTLHLNKNAVWGDGTPISVADYQATWNACNGENADFLCASTDGFDHITSVEQGADEFEVVVTYKDVFPDWSAALSTVAPAAGVSDPETFNEGWNEPNNDWLAGPYQVSGVDVAQQVISLEPNPAWWGEEPMLDSLSFRVMDPSANGTAFAGSEIDVLTGIISAQEYLEAATRADGEIRRAGGLQWRHVTFNGESGVLQDKDLRATIVRGIDRVAITESDLAGIPDLVPVDLVLGNHFFMPGQEGYEDNGVDYSYDPERAAKELDEQGWVLEDGAEYRTKDGETLAFEYMMMPDVPTSKNEGELMQAQLKEIGVQMTIRNVESATFFDEVLAGSFGTTTFAWQGTPYPMANINQIYSCKQFAPEGQNYARICDERIDELSAKIAVEPDHAERLKMANEVDAIIWENTMVLPLYRRMEMTAVPANLANYGAFGMSSVQGENVGFLK